MTNREISIDVLRGLAIAGMVLSGTISRNPELPAWLYHAQIAPPDFIFNPSLAGITWVDLVFPFFLFAMGMAFPFSLNRSIEKGILKSSILKRIVARSLKLLFFAILLGHLSPFHYPQELGWIRYMMGLLAFAGFFLAFSKFPHWSRHENKINIAGYVFLIILVIIRSQIFNLTFSIHSNDIIILVLANMAFFGGAIWLVSHNNWFLRLGIMALYFAWRLTQGVEGSWNQMLWDFTPFKWLANVFPVLYEGLLSYGIDLKRTIFYNPEFLKYLMIVIPGTIAGDLVHAGLHEKVARDKNKWESVFILIPSVLLVNLIFNLYGLLSRNLDFVWIMNIITLLAVAWMMNKESFRNFKALRTLLAWSMFWLMLGLVFEAWQGGIKKDSATISYFFLTSGLAGFSIVIFKMSSIIFQPGRSFGFAALTGMNPMFGYVVASYMIMPLLYFVQVLPWMDLWHTHYAWAGLLRGVVLTSLMVVVTVFSVKRGLLWKT